MLLLHLINVNHCVLPSDVTFVSTFGKRLSVSLSGHRSNLVSTACKDAPIVLPSQLAGISTLIIMIFPPWSQKTSGRVSQVSHETSQLASTLVYILVH
jgi:hypothetical protein